MYGVTKLVELRRKVLRAGFRLEFETSLGSLLLPAMLASRLTRQGTKAAEESMSELSLPTWLNRAFEFVMSLERFLLRSGLRLKLDGSRLLIAKKDR